VAQMARFGHPSGIGVGLSHPQEIPAWAQGCRYGPLCYSTRLAWPGFLERNDPERPADTRMSPAA
jgi:hypothetical protein